VTYSFSHSAWTFFAHQTSCVAGLALSILAGKGASKAAERSTTIRRDYHQLSRQLYCTGGLSPVGRSSVLETPCHKWPVFFTTIGYAYRRPSSSMAR
jgi:hypothetical protein